MIGKTENNFFMLYLEGVRKYHKNFYMFFWKLVYTNKDTVFFIDKIIGN